MNCIVTAGPTYESLDEVRRLTNFSTGRLGTELAGYLTDQGHEVTLLIGQLSTWPGERRAGAVELFSSTEDLQSKLKACSRRKVDAIFHAAAVSDFTFGKIFIRDAAGKLKRLATTKKISTRSGTLMAELVPTPKIIAKLRNWYPRSCIIGWKYEADGKRPDAVERAQKQIEECSTDACVANGPAYGLGFGLVTKPGQRHFRSPKDLFPALEEFARVHASKSRR